ncbi:MAG: zf-HC2 domain-containing protein [Candidatus Zixiibacteriota bacterium]|nr:MAG: zf-HC2 domain-containing protein [candidate division Zixibacteria bacterium]
MKCKEFEELMTAYLGDDIPPDKRHSFEQHIESCERCQAEMATYENCAKFFQRFIKDEDPPEALRKAVLEKCGCQDPSECCPPPKREQ